MRVRYAYLVFILLSMFLIRKTCADGKLCGVEAAYGAVNAIGVKANLRFDELLTQEYISEIGGSTAKDVCHAVRQLGAEAIFVEGMGWASLVNSTHPIILNVASDGQLEATNHWLLYLGLEGNMARVVDGSGMVENWPMERLLVRWAGKGVLVSTSGEVDRIKRYLNQCECVAMFTLLTLSLVLCAGGIHLFHSITNKWFFGWAMLATIVGTQLVLTCLFSLASPPIPWSPTSRYVSSTINGETYEDIGLQEFSSLLKSPGKAIIIDCRYASDFRTHPVPGTINIPIDSGTSFVSQSLVGINPNQRIVLFCMSEGCGFATVMAKRLTGLGFSNINVFTGGYKAWTEDSLER